MPTKKKKSSAYIFASLLMFFLAGIVYIDTYNLFFALMLGLAGLGIGLLGS